MKKIISSLVLGSMLFTAVSAKANDKDSMDRTTAGMLHVGVAFGIEYPAALAFMVNATTNIEQKIIGAQEELDRSKKIFTTIEQKHKALNSLDKKIADETEKMHHSENLGNQAIQRDYQAKINTLRDELETVSNKPILSAEQKKEIVAKAQAKLEKAKVTVEKWREHSGKIRFVQGIAGGVILMDVIGKVIALVRNDYEFFEDPYSMIPGSALIPAITNHN